MNLLESYRQTHTYDIGNNLIRLSRQAQSNAWQQTIDIHPNSNRGTENNNPNNFDTNGNLLNLDNIGKLNWHYNNTLAKLVKQDKINAIEYYVYDHQGNRVRTVIESNHQAQSQKIYLPSLDILTNINNPQINTLHIGTHILSEQTKDSAQTRYQLSSHLQTNTLELNDQAKIISYEHYYPYGGTAIIAGKDKTQVQQKRYRYTGKERDDSSGLCYYGARYLAPWLARWISPDSAGSVDGLNLYVYVGNNPLKYVDPTGYAKVYSFKGLNLYDIDVLSPVGMSVHNDSTFLFPEAYQRVVDTVRNIPADEYHKLDRGTRFSIKSRGDRGNVLAVEARTQVTTDLFTNMMDFSTGVLTFEINFACNRRQPNSDLKLNATQITAYQYLGMSKIAKATNRLPRTFLREGISNALANIIIMTYEFDRNYLTFRKDFLYESDNGRSSLRIAHAFSLKVASIELHRNNGRNVYLYLERQSALESVERPFVLPPRTMDKNGNRIIEQKNCTIL
ncbi:insecticidal toxin complex protein [Bathymodiolus thermophilus thioautotrophic gill symbiont]|uniref:RHS repeat-associated core domain-containing protein n=1 Tax=Bathymodiolus thermophilus thioautotrophic gill symbiont TaxID=2360 RepID=UPI0010B486CC|nr:RHS repeat-associated core domain-containing protein [Bathymodiolus thermophilus thioautotrophic gill symbiont]SGZ99442.1 insecticidal toxin complex protein [Bathymodiolus thermophilus thioautotrophic gill symbiont]